MSEVEPLKHCFMITPIGSVGSATRKHADWVFRFVNDACKARNIILDRADRMTGSPMITTRIFKALKTAHFCVADLSGLNANVFYELGVRHSLRLPVIHCAHEGTDLPFDNAQHHTLFFDISDSSSMEQFAENVGARIDEMSGGGFTVSNPFTQALGSIEVAKSGDPLSKVVVQLSERIATLENASRPASRISPRSAPRLSDARNIRRLQGALSGHPINELEVEAILNTCDLTSKPLVKELKTIVQNANPNAKSVVASVLGRRLSSSEMGVVLLEKELDDEEG